MNAKERNERIRNQQQSDLDLIERKGHDYSGDEDCLRNFVDFGYLGVLVRLSDKLSRLKALYKSGVPMVKSESVVDTLQDIRNYAHIGQIIYENEWQKE